MNILEKYMPEYQLTEESKIFKSFKRRIQSAKTSKDINKILADVKKAVKTDSCGEKEALKLVDMADDKLAEIE